MDFVTYVLLPFFKATQRKNVGVRAPRPTFGLRNTDYRLRKNISLISNKLASAGMTQSKLSLSTVTVTNYAAWPHLRSENRKRKLSIIHYYLLKSVACSYIAVFVASGEPFHSLAGRAVGEAIWHHIPLRAFLKSVITYLVGGIKRLLDISPL